MLAYILAIAVGLASFGLYMAAFFFPEVHRKSDFVWSGVGLFYGLILWVCAGRMTGAVLLGQVASVSLLVGFGWEILTLRRNATPIPEKTPIPAKVKQRLNGFLGVQSPVVFSEATKNGVTAREPVSENHSIEDATPVETQEQPEPEMISPSPEIVEEPAIAPITPEPNLPEVLETPPVTKVEPTAVDTPRVEAKKTPRTPQVKTTKTDSKPPKSIPAIAGTLSGLVSNLTGLFNKKPKTPKTPSQAPSPEPTPAPPVTGDDFAEFEALETSVAEGTTTPESQETVEKSAPSPFEQIVTPPVEEGVETSIEAVNPMVMDIQDSGTEAISSETHPVEPETFQEEIAVSEIETPAEELSPPSLTPEVSEPKSSPSKPDES